MQIKPGRRGIKSGVKLLFQWNLHASVKPESPRGLRLGGTGAVASLALGPGNVGQCRSLLPPRPVGGAAAGVPQLITRQPAETPAIKTSS